MSRSAAALPWRFAGTVLLLWTLLRVFSGAVLTWIAVSQQDPVVFRGDYARYFDVATLWDGQWYERIATQGYPTTLPTDGGQVQQNPWAFYPIFPVLARGLMAVSGWPFAVAATVLATVLGYAAALVVAGLLRQQVGTAGAIAGVALLGAYPAAPTLQVAYTESLALLLLGAVLWLLVRRSWFAAAGVALLTGLARPITLPLGLVALVCVIVRWRARRTDPIAQREGWGMLASLAACGLGGLIWPVIAWWRTGAADAYTLTMAAWRADEQVVPFVPAWERVQGLYGEVAGPLLLLLALALLGAAVLGPWARGLGVALRTWCLAYGFYLVAALDPWTSVFRYLILMFPLFVILAGAGRGVGGGAGRRAVLVRTVLLVTVFLVLQVWWTWELFRFVPPMDDPP